MNWKGYGRRILSVCLVWLLCLSYLPWSVYASDKNTLGILYHESGTIVNNGDYVLEEEGLKWEKQISIQYGTSETIHVPSGLLPQSVSVTGLDGASAVLQPDGSIEVTAPGNEEDGDYHVGDDTYTPSEDTTPVPTGSITLSVTCQIDSSKIDESSRKITIMGMVLEVLYPILPDYTAELFYRDSGGSNQVLQDGAELSLSQVLSFEAYKNHLGDIQAGKTYTIPMPDCFILQHSINETLQSDSVSFGTLKGDAGKSYVTVIFQLSAEHENDYELSDFKNIYLYFDFEINPDAKQDAGEDGILTVDLPGMGTKSFVITDWKPVPPVPPEIGGVTAELNKQTGITTWKVTYQGPNQQYEGTIPDVLKAIIPDELILISDPITIKQCDGSSEDIEAVYGQEDKGDCTYLIDQDTGVTTLSYQIPTDTECLTLIYQTKLGDEAIQHYWSSGTGKKYTVQAEAVHETEVVSSKSGSVSVDGLPKLVSMGNAGYEYDNTAGNYKINWVVEGNTLGKQLPELMVTLSYTEGYLEDFTDWVENGSIVLESNGVTIPIDIRSISYDYDRNQIVLNLTDYQTQFQNGRFLIRYSMRTNSEMSTPGADFSQVSMNHGVSAQYKMTGQETQPYQTQTVMGTAPSYEQVVLEKEEIGYDVRERKIQWKITINPSSKIGEPLANFTSIHLQDSIPSTGQAQVFFLNETQKIQQEQTIEEAVKQAGGHVSSVDIDIKKEQLDIKIEGLGQRTLEIPVATYEKNPFYWAGNASKYDYTNRAVLVPTGTKIDNQPLKREIESQATIQVKGGDALVKNMPTYTPDSHILTWTISLNERGANLGTVQIEDWLPQGVSYVDGSAKVDGIPIEVSQMDGNGIVFQIEQVTNAKTLTYQTEVNESVLKAKRKISLTNQAQLYIWENNKWQDTILPNDDKRKETVTIDQPVITKEAVVGKENGSNKIDYRIEINPSGVDLLNGQEGNIWLLDELGDGLILNEDSIQLYEANVDNQKGTLVLSKGQLVADAQISVDSVYHTFTVTLPKANQPYILTYTTYATRLKNLSNRASLQGVQAWEQDWQSLEASTQTNISNAGGSGTLPPKNIYVSLQFQKVDGTTNQPLSGAEIGLYLNEYDETSMLTSGKTDETGLCVLSVKKKLLKDVDTLYYKELSAPDGYLEDVQWYEISINEIQNTPIRFENKPIEQGRKAHITLEVYDVLTEEPVPMAEFALYKYADDKDPFMVRQTNIFGILTFDNLVEGHEYFIRVVDMPEDYHLDKKEDFEVEADITDNIVEIPAQVGPDGGDGEGTPPEGGGGEGTPPEGGGEGTPPEGGDGEGTPPEGGDGEGTPPEGGGGEGTPPEGGGGEGTPPEGGDGEGTPPEGGGGEGTPPEGGGGEGTPPEGGETPPDGGDGGETPPDGDDSGETPPDGGDGGETPPDGGDGGETPPNGGDSSETPPNGGDDSDSVEIPSDGADGDLIVPEEEANGETQPDSGTNPPEETNSIDNNEPPFSDTSKTEISGAGDRKELTSQTEEPIPKTGIAHRKYVMIVGMILSATMSALLTMVYFKKWKNDGKDGSR